MIKMSMCVFFFFPERVGGVRKENTSEYKKAEEKKQRGRRGVEDLDLKRVIPFQIGRAHV